MLSSFDLAVCASFWDGDTVNIVDAPGLFYKSTAMHPRMYHLLGGFVEGWNIVSTTAVTPVDAYSSFQSFGASEMWTAVSRHAVQSIQHFLKDTREVKQLEDQLCQRPYHYMKLFLALFRRLTKYRRRRLQIRTRHKTSLEMLAVSGLMYILTLSRVEGPYMQ